MGQEQSAGKRGGGDNGQAKLSDSLDKVEKELAAEAAKNAPPVEIATIDDIPVEYREKLERAHIPLDVAGKDENLDVTLNILHFLYKRRFKRKNVPKKDSIVIRDRSPHRKHKKRRSSQAPSVRDSTESNKSSKQGTDLEVVEEDAGKQSTEESAHPKKPRRKKRDIIPDNASDPGTPTSERAPKTDSIASEQKKPELPEDELTEAETKREQEVIVFGQDASKIFKSFQAHGSGGFGTVERAKNAKTKDIVAIKHTPHSTIKQRRANIQEISFLTRLKGKPNIVEFHTAYKHNDEVWMIMEFMEGGTLSQALKAWSFKEPQIAYFAREVLKGLKVLHNANLAHRDIKPHNIMLDVDGFVKLIDFGLCIDLNENKDPKNMVGSAYWMAPEMIARKVHGPKVDIFSLGMVVYELMSGEPLTAAFKPLQAMFLNGVHGGPPLESITAKNTEAEPWSSESLDFLKKCLTKDADARPSAEKLLEHPFLKRADTANEMKRILKLIFLSNSLQMQGIGI